MHRLQSRCQWPWLPLSPLPVMLQARGKRVGVLASRFARLSRSGGKPRIILRWSEVRTNWRYPISRNVNDYFFHYLSLLLSSFILLFPCTFPFCPSFALSFFFLFSFFLLDLLNFMFLPFYFFNLSAHLNFFPLLIHSPFSFSGSLQLFNPFEFLRRALTTCKMENKKAVGYKTEISLPFILL